MWLSTTGPVGGSGIGGDGGDGTGWLLTLDLVVEVLVVENQE